MTWDWWHIANLAFTGWLFYVLVFDRNYTSTLKRWEYWAMFIIVLFWIAHWVFGIDKPFYL